MRHLGMIHDKVRTHNIYLKPIQVCVSNPPSFQLSSRWWPTCQRRCRRHWQSRPSRCPRPASRGRPRLTRRRDPSRIRFDKKKGQICLQSRNIYKWHSSHLYLKIKQTRLSYNVGGLSKQRRCTGPRHVVMKRSEKIDTVFINYTSF